MYMLPMEDTVRMYNSNVEEEKKKKEEKEKKEKKEFFFFNDTATTEIYTLSLHDALPISNALRSQTTTTAKGTS